MKRRLEGLTLTRACVPRYATDRQGTRTGDGDQVLLSFLSFNARKEERWLPTAQSCCSQAHVLQPATANIATPTLVHDSKTRVSSCSACEFAKPAVTAVAPVHPAAELQLESGPPPAPEPGVRRRLAAGRLPGLRPPTGKPGVGLASLRLALVPGQQLCPAPHPPTQPEAPATVIPTVPGLACAAAKQAFPDVCPIHVGGATANITAAAALLSGPCEQAVNASSHSSAAAEPAIAAVAPACGKDAAAAATTGSPSPSAAGSSPASAAMKPAAPTIAVCIHKDGATGMIAAAVPTQQDTDAAPVLGPEARRRRLAAGRLPGLRPLTGEPGVGLASLRLARGQRQQPGVGLAPQLAVQPEAPVTLAAFAAVPESTAPVAPNDKAAASSGLACCAVKPSAGTAGGPVYGGGASAAAATAAAAQLHQEPPPPAAAGLSPACTAAGLPAAAVTLPHEHDAALVTAAATVLQPEPGAPPAPGPGGGARNNRLGGAGRLPGLRPLNGEPGVGLGSLRLGLGPGTQPGLAPRPATHPVMPVALGAGGGLGARDASGAVGMQAPAPAAQSVVQGGAHGLTSRNGDNIVSAPGHVQRLGPDATASTTGRAPPAAAPGPVIIGRGEGSPEADEGGEDSGSDSYSSCSWGASHSSGNGSGGYGVNGGSTGCTGSSILSGNEGGAEADQEVGSVRSAEALVSVVPTTRADAAAAPVPDVIAGAVCISGNTTPGVDAEAMEAAAETVEEEAAQPPVLTAIAGCELAGGHFSRHRGSGGSRQVGPPWALLPRSRRVMRTCAAAARAIWPALFDPARVAFQTVTLCVDLHGPAGGGSSSAIVIRAQLRRYDDRVAVLRALEPWPPLPPGLPWGATLQIEPHPSGDGSALVQLPGPALQRRLSVRRHGPRPPALNARQEAVPLEPLRKAAPHRDVGSLVPLPAAVGAAVAVAAAASGGGGEVMAMRTVLGVRMYGNAQLRVSCAAARVVFANLLGLGLSGGVGGGGGDGDAQPAAVGAAAAAGSGSGGNNNDTSDGGAAESGEGLELLRHITLIPVDWPEARFTVPLRFRFPARHPPPPPAPAANGEAPAVPRPNGSARAVAQLGPEVWSAVVLYGAEPGDVLEVWRRPGGAPEEFHCRVVGPGSDMRAAARSGAAVPPAVMAAAHASV